MLDLLDLKDRLKLNWNKDNIWIWGGYIFFISFLKYNFCMKDE